MKWRTCIYRTARRSCPSWDFLVVKCSARACARGRTSWFRCGVLVSSRRRRLAAVSRARGWSQISRRCGVRVENFAADGFATVRRDVPCPRVACGLVFAAYFWLDSDSSQRLKHTSIQNHPSESTKARVHGVLVSPLDTIQTNGGMKTCSRFRPITRRCRA